jgi:putative tryptophan/tyrosine transport system substrate-binding protein
MVPWAKQMELAREVVPGASRIGVLNDADDPKAVPQWQELQAAGQALGVIVTDAEVRTPDDLVNAIQALANQKPNVVIVLQTSMLLSQRQKISSLEEAMRLPMVYGYREHVVDGGLISYGVELRNCFRRSAAYVDKILKGTAPGDLPVEFPTKVELVINLKTARAIGIQVPPTLIARADEIIE